MTNESSSQLYCIIIYCISHSSPAKRIRTRALDGCLITIGRRNDFRSVRSLSNGVIKPGESVGRTMVGERNALRNL